MVAAFAVVCMVIVNVSSNPHFAGEKITSNIKSRRKMHFTFNQMVILRGGYISSSINLVITFAAITNIRQASQMHDNGI